MRVSGVIEINIEREPGARRGHGFGRRVRAIARFRPDEHAATKPPRRVMIGRIFPDVPSSVGRRWRQRVAFKLKR